MRHRMSDHSCFFFNDPATTEIYTLSLHDALPILANRGPNTNSQQFFITDDAAPHLDKSYTIFGECKPIETIHAIAALPDRKSTRLNSSHVEISYAVFCLKKKKKKTSLKHNT